MQIQNFLNTAATRIKSDVVPFMTAMAIIAALTMFCMASYHVFSLPGDVIEQAKRDRVVAEFARAHGKPYPAVEISQKAPQNATVGEVTQ